MRTHATRRQTNSPASRLWPHKPVTTGPDQVTYHAGAMARWKAEYPKEAELYHRYLYLQRSPERSIVPAPFKVNPVLLAKAKESLHLSA